MNYKNAKNWTDRWNPKEVNGINKVFCYDKYSKIVALRLTHEEKISKRREIIEMIKWHKARGLDYSHYIKMKKYFRL